MTDIVISHLIMRARVWGKFACCTCCTFCTCGMFGHFFYADAYSRRFGKVESGAQVHFSTLGVECVGEYPFGMFALILGRHPEALFRTTNK